ncbi:MAG: SusF/SusE family outer membrane protein [Muribaculaceae bacterium]|nr:SusF/SusE family outer membrane protein [Muribaculaceae bacterium]
MNTILKCFVAGAALLAAATASADDKGRLYIIGEATEGGWSLDKAQALLSTAEAPAVYTGTLYLKGGETNTFKFLVNHEFGGEEYGLAPDAASTVVNGDVKLAEGTSDNGYRQLSVAESGNYLITVDTATLEASVTRSEYQGSPVEYTSLFLIGSATAGGWSVEDGTALVQEAGTPYIYEAVVPLKATDNGSPASFKIARAVRGGGSFDAAYYFFRDADDAGKISTDSTDDRQWSVSDDGNYTVTVNTLANKIDIAKYTGSSTGIENVEVEQGTDCPELYYDLTGRRVLNPSRGVYIRVQGTDARKVLL